MSTAELPSFLVPYLFVVGAVAVLAALIRVTVPRVLTALVSLGALAGLLVLISLTYPDENVLQGLINALRFREARSLVLMGMGGGSGLAWLAVLLAVEQVGDRRERSRFENPFPSIVLIGSLLAMAGGGALFFFNELYREQRRTRAFEPGFKIDVVARIPDPNNKPIRIASGDEGRVYVTFDRSIYGEDMGGVLELTPDPETGGMTQRVVALSTHLDRPYGLAVKDGDLYVSHSGRIGKARSGRISYVPGGAVTQLKDLDGDGFFEFYHDVVPDLPGAGGRKASIRTTGSPLGPMGACT